jgi:tRNA-modifying protein YgfZ
VTGPDAASYLERMLSNEVETLDLHGSCEALLLTPKARVIATVTVWRRGHDDFLLLTEPELGDRLRAELVRYRFAAKAVIDVEEHSSTLLLGADAPGGAIPNSDYGMSAYETIDAGVPEGAEMISPDELELLRIRAATPRMGLEIDDRVLPAEAGLTERAVSFTKGCYPGQEPVARLHYRGHVNRRLCVLAVDGQVEPGAEISYDGKAVGRITSAVDGLALAYVRTEVPEDATLAVGDVSARMRPA